MSSLFESQSEKFDLERIVSSDELLVVGQQQQQHHFDNSHFFSQNTFSQQQHIDFSTLEASIERLEAATGFRSDSITKGILLVFFKRLIMIINSILGEYKHKKRRRRRDNILH